jgi:hypothetical protein
MFYPEAETGAKFFGIREIRTKAADGTESRLRQQSLSIQNIRVRAIEGGVLPDQDFQDYRDKQTSHRFFSLTDPLFVHSDFLLFIVYSVTLSLMTSLD